MARFTNVRRINVAVGQTVTACTGTGAIHFIVVNGEWWCPTRAHVARFANVRRIYVPARQTVATGTRTGAIHFRMINGGYRNPDRC